MNMPFTGTVSGSKVTLNLETGITGTPTKLSATISSSHLHISNDAGFTDLGAATRAQFNAAVVALIPRVSQTELSQQNELAKEASVREGIHSLQIAIQSYAVDHNDVYPTEVTQAMVKSYVDTWPDNPYTGVPMAPGTGAGDYEYTSDGSSFQLVGYGSGGSALITVP